MYEIKISLQMLYEKLSARCAAEAHIERRERCITDLRLTVPEAGTANRSYVYLCRGSVPGHTLFRHPDGEIEVAAEWVDAANAAMEIFGSYMSDEHTLPGEAVRICALDTFVALMAGTIIFPACFSYNVELDHGPALIFMTLPKIFLDMPGGRVWGSLFFLFMTFASFSTVTAVFENLIASACDNWGWSRKKSVGIVGAVLFLTSIPCVLGYNVWSGFHPMPGKDILDFEDFLVSSLLLPIGSLVYLLFCVSKRGWGFDKYLAECNKGTGIKMSPKFKVYFRYILPILIIIILVVGLVPLFR